MKKLLLHTTYLALKIGLILAFTLGGVGDVWGQSVSATYTSGNISSDYGFQSLPGSSTCPGTLVVNIPTGAVITSVDVQYSMTGANDSYVADQRSQLRCTSTGGTGETSITAGSGNYSNYTINYSRTGLTIANGVSGGGNITFQLHAGRVWGGSSCNTTYQYVNNNTWKVTVYYNEPPGQKTFYSSDNFIVPGGVTSITVECWGGGGKGGSRTSSGSAMGGGGGGGYSKSTFTGLTSGTQYTVTVGAGSTTTAAGGDSYFNNTTTVLAKGGNSVANNSATGAAGGLASDGVGSSKYSGGTGATGSGSSAGGGGSSAGTGANGNNGSGSTGGTAPDGGGAGGAGRSGTSGNGTAGSTPGGGGGGAYRTSGSPTGGYGANGKVIITWTPGPPSCTTPISPVNGVTDIARNSTLNWNAITGATGYYLYFGTNNPPTNIINGASQTATTYTPASNLGVNTTYYWKVVPYNLFGPATGCPVWSFQTAGCTSGGNNYSREWITGVNLGSFSKTSGAAGYSDFTSDVINLTAGSANSITLTPGFAGAAVNEYWKVWIDFNGDQDFEEAGEELLSVQSTGAATGTITLPGTVVNTRMRIAMAGSHTGDLTVPGGNITAQYTDSPAGEDITKLIDNSSATKFLTLSHASVWVQYRFPNSNRYVVTRYTITSANDSEERDPKDWTLQGSNNGSTWVTVDTRSNEDFASRLLTREFVCANTTAYEYYRLNMTNNSGTILQVAEWELYGPVNNNYPAPCETFAYGEVEDYTVNIQPACTNGILTLTSVAGTDNQEVCYNTPIINITYTVGGGATGAMLSGQPTGISGNFSGGVFTISGTPTSSGTFNYTVTTTGTPSSCSETSVTGTIKVNTLPTVSTSLKHITCYNGTDGEITITASGGVGPYQFSIHNGDAGTWVSGDHPDYHAFKELIANVQYKIRVKDSNECASPIIP